MFQRFGFRLQYISDLHLEYRQKMPLVQPKTNYLALLGDIGYPNQKNYQDFLKYCSAFWDQVLLISGNHEYFPKKYSKQEIDDIILNLASKYHNVHFLNNTGCLLENYLVLGTTLWSNNVDEPWIQKEHQKSVAWLETRLTSKRNTIVLSHYLPSYRLIVPKYRQHPRPHRYASVLDHLFRPPLIAWLCGHSHCQYETTINDIYCGINAYHRN